MQHGTLLSIQVGRPRHQMRDGKSWYSGYVKEPVFDPVWVGRTNLEGDGQAMAHHGGPDKAVLAYCAGHYPLWRADLAPLSLPHGAFGENLTVAGLNEETVCVGDIYQIGEARLQVSQPRQPCASISTCWEISDLADRVLTTGRTGWYLRVLAEGWIESGQEALLLERSFPQWTVTRAAAAMRGRKTDRETALYLAACPALSADWQARLRAE